MKTTVTCYMFIEAARSTGRLDKFGVDGWRALFDYIEEYEQDTGEEQEMDIIALCCDLSRYESIAEFNAEYGEECETLQDVQDLTVVIPINGDDDGPFLAVNY